MTAYALNGIDAMEREAARELAEADSRPVEYGDWLITRAWTGGTQWDWQYIHKDYDGPGDQRIGYCATVADCKAEIDREFSE
jgi:hypothetical protein